MLLKTVTLCPYIARSQNKSLSNETNQLIHIKISMQQTKKLPQQNEHTKIIQRTPNNGRGHRRSNSFKIYNRHVHLAKADQQYLLEHVKKLQIMQSELFSRQINKIMQEELAKLVNRSEQYCKTSHKTQNAGIQNNKVPIAKVLKGFAKISGVLLKKQLNTKVLAFNQLRKHSRLIVNKNKSATFRKKSFIEDDIESSGDVEGSGCFISKKSSSRQKNPITVTYNVYKMNVKDLEKDTQGCFVLNLDGKYHTKKVYQGESSEMIIFNGLDSQQPTRR